MKHSESTPDYLKAYQEAVDTHGGTFDATLWRSKEGQLLRFKTFCDLIDFTEMSILDVGCGIGDFSGYLTEEEINFQSFHGIDAMEEMIQTAIERNLPRSSFSTVDAVRKPDTFRGYDWITFSGTLNAMDEEVAMDLIGVAFEACGKGVGFNFLSDRSNRIKNNEDLFPASRFSTLAWIDNALYLSPNVDFTQSYLGGHDATIVIKKIHEIPQ